MMKVFDGLRAIVSRRIKAKEALALTRVCNTVKACQIRAISDAFYQMRLEI
jgi:hypothetical protein